MREPLLRPRQRTPFKATAFTLITTTLFATAAASAMAQESATALPPPSASADPVSIIIAEEAPKNTLAAFFSFDSPGGFTWWAGAILGALGCCAFASMIIIRVETNCREPPAVMALMSAQQCPLLSSLLPPLAFEAWRSTCSRVSRGTAYTCASSADCTALGSTCADPALLAQLQCAHTGTGADATRLVCAYPSFNASATSSTTLTSGFCTNANTTCALCLSGTCGTTTPSAGSIGCPSTSACSSSPWLCNPLDL